jgi:polar amino acid transport system substrate-binding protein
MTGPITMPARLLLLALLLPLVAATGCGGEEQAAAGSRPLTPYDKALHATLPDDVRTSGVLRVATDASYAPASSFADDGRTIVGFEPDLGAALGRVLGVELRFGQRKFSGLLKDVTSGRTDLVMSAMTDTRERQRAADFVNYFSAGTAILVQRGNPIGITDLVRLCGRSSPSRTGPRRSTCWSARRSTAASSRSRSRRTTPTPTRSSSCGPAAPRRC